MTKKQAHNKEKKKGRLRKEEIAGQARSDKKEEATKTFKNVLESSQNTSNSKYQQI